MDYILFEYLMFLAREEKALIVDFFRSPLSQKASDFFDF